MFSKFGMYLTYKNWLLGHFHGFWAGTSTQPFGPGTGPKSKLKCCYILTGLSILESPHLNPENTDRRKICDSSE